MHNNKILNTLKIIILFLAVFLVHFPIDLLFHEKNMGNDPERTIFFSF